MRIVPGPILVTMVIMLETIFVPGRVFDTLLRFDDMKTRLWKLPLFGPTRPCVVPTMATAALRMTFRGLTHTHELVATRLHRSMFNVPKCL